MDKDITWLAEAGLDIKTGIGYTGGEDRYISAVYRFYSNYEKNSNKVEEYYAAKDYENYKITVHALKSNAKMIGAVNLSSEFAMLEKAASDNDIATIDDSTNRTLSAYKTLIEKLKAIEEFAEVRDADEISGEAAKKIAAELLKALDYFDDELSKKLAVKLSGYPFRLTQKDKLKSAIEYIDDFMYDDAADIIRKISTTIE